MARLTQAERRAILSAIAFLDAGEFDECAGPDPGFDREDLDSAAQKIANGLNEPRCKKLV